MSKSGRSRASLERWFARAEDCLFEGDLEPALAAPTVTAGQPLVMMGRAWALRASALRRSDRFDAAGQAYERALALADDDGWILARVTFYYLACERFAEAREAAARAVELAQTHRALAEARAARAQLRAFDSDLPGALDDWAATAAR